MGKLYRASRFSMIHRSAQLKIAINSGFCSASLVGGVVEKLLTMLTVNAGVLNFQGIRRAAQIINVYRSCGRFTNRLLNQE